MTQMDDGPSGAVPHDPIPVHGDVPSGPEDVLPARPVGRRAKPPVEGTPSPLGRAVLPVILVLVAVVAVGAAWRQLNASDPSTVAGPTPSPSSSSSASGSASGSPSATSASPTTSPKPTKSSSPAPTSSATSTSSPTPSTAPVVIDRSVPVTVLNGTRRTGLAARVANELRSKGWTVVSIGNWRGGGVSTTTVFVNGRDDAAATMRRDLEAADATKAPIGAMRDNRITVVVMGDYPQG